MVEPSLESMGYSIVLIKMLENGGRKTLSIMAERNDGNNMTVDDCSTISHTASTLLEVDDPISGAYDLEVCSPGIDRPLTRLKDFTSHAGFEAKLETQVPVNGRRRFKGTLKGTEGETIKIAMPEGDMMDIPFRNIRTAKLVLTDALMASFLKKQKDKEV